jgi:hypothetical protein
MAKRRKLTSSPVAIAPDAPGEATTFWRREGPLVVGGAAVLCLAAGYLSRKAMNPDGVSYLDLAGAVPRGDWSQFVQGYWSPLLPLLAGIAGGITGASHTALVTLVHAGNVIAAIAALGILFVWGRRIGSPTMVLASVAAFLLASAGIPRVEAVTPDVLLFAVTVALSCELALHRGRRWIATGILLGAAYLVKTSCWPWLAATFVVRLFAARDHHARLRVLWSSGVAALVMLLWIVPLSVKSGRFTLGSAGRLNYSWYIDGNTSRLPDSDLGTNSAYREISVGGNQEVTLATFDDAAHWTYQPWGDPATWSAGVTSETGSPPVPTALLSYWLRQTARIIGLWLMPLLAAVLFPTYILRRRPGIWRDGINANRDAVVTAFLGVIGVLQFAAIHAEPRLIAPFAMMLTLGALQWWCNDVGTVAAQRMARGRRIAVGSIGLLAGIGFAVPKFIDGVSAAARLDVVTAQLEEVHTRLGTGDAPVEVAIVGPAAPVLSAAYIIGAHVTAQILPRSARVVAQLPDEQRSRLLIGLFGGRATLVWETTDDGGMQMLLIPKS